MRRIFLFLIALLPIQPALAVCEIENTDDISTELQISALYPNPNTGEQEWIELTNLSDDPIDLTLYTLEDATAHPWAMSGTLDETIRLTGFSFQLNNSNETVTLKTINGEIVDTWTYATSTKGVSLLRSSEDENSSESETTSITVNPPASSTPTHWPDFSEAMPNPEGSDSTDEWIELYNPYGEALTLDGLSLDDSEGGSSPHLLSGSLPPESYLLIYVAESKITLNNDSDHIRLLGINNEILWDVSYSSSKEGQSYADFGGSYSWTEEPSPGFENLSTNSETDASENDDTSSSDYQNGDLSDGMSITEVLPNPEGPDTENEWIEITNASDESINLGNWTLDDGPGGSDPFIFPDTTVLMPGETLVLYRSDTGLALNNSDETIQLSDYTGEIISEIHFDTSEEDESYAEIQVEEMQSKQAAASGLGNQVFSTWQWVTPSPGALNPVWKQIKGTVTEFDGSLLTLFDGISSWTFKIANADGTDELTYDTGNTVLVQAQEQDGLYEVMHGELISTGKKENPSHFPWEILVGATLITGYGAYEIYKRRKSWHLDLKPLN